jgi:hypothetical protein
MLCKPMHTFRALSELTNTIILLQAIHLFLSVQTHVIFNLISEAKETLFHQ